MPTDQALVGLQKALSSFNPNSCQSDEERQELLSAARSLCAKLEKPMESLLRLAWIEPAYAACLKIGVDIGLFDALGGDANGASYSTEQLAQATATDKEFLQRILRLLVSMGTLVQDGDDSFSATALSCALIERPCSATVDFRFVISNPLFQHLPAFLKKTGYKSPSNLVDTSWQMAVGTNLSFFAWLGQNPEALEMFTNHMAGYTSQRGTWEALYPVRDRLLSGKGISEDTQDIILVDLGGGAGHDLKRFASSFAPTWQRPCLVLQDLPEVIDQVNKDGSLPPAISGVAVDFTKEPPVSGARGYYMHSVLHDWPDADVVKILEKMHPVLLKKTSDGFTPKLLINENVLPKQGVQLQAAALDMIMMAAFASRERSEEQWRSLLEVAGYKITGIFSKPGIVEAVMEAEAV